jgi:hypothetical protein
MSIDQIISASIANGAVVPADLSTGAPSWDASGNLTPVAQIRGTASGVPPILADSAGNTATCRAWVNINGSTTAIRGSFNVSSVTQNSTGKFTVTLANALPDANYSVVLGNVESGTSNNQIMNVRSDVAVSSSVFGIATYSGTTPQNLTSLYFAVFR